MGCDFEVIHDSAFFNVMKVLKRFEGAEWVLRTHTQAEIVASLHTYLKMSTVIKIEQQCSAVQPWASRLNKMLLNMIDVRFALQ